MIKYLLTANSMEKNKLSLLAASLVFLVTLSQTAFALPTVVSELDQTFDENEASQQLLTITITEDAEELYIKEGSLKLTIPASLSIIFDATRTAPEIVLIGTAVRNGKIAERPAVTFEDKDKTLVIPVLANFATGEVVTISKVYVEGFYEPSNSDYLVMTLEGDETEYKDTKYIFVRDSSLQDEFAPDKPTNLVVSDVEGGGVKLTWTNPTDLDLNNVQVLRGKNNDPISGTSYATVTAPTAEFVDMDVVPGDTVKFILKANDGVNFGENSDEISFVVGSGSTAPAEEVVEEPVADPIEEVVDDTEDPSTEEPSAIPEEEPPALFSDIAGHWAESIILGMASQNIIYGNPDGTFSPDGKLNRAEAAALIYRILSPGGDPATPAEKPFSDVKLSDWFTGYVSEISTLGLVKGYKDESGNTTYQPGKNVTRAEFLKMAMNLYYYNGNAELKAQIDALRDDETTSEYEDISSSDWYAPDVTAATKLGFVAGSKCEENTCFNPTSDITRAEATKILYEIFFAISS